MIIFEYLVFGVNPYFTHGFEIEYVVEVFWGLTLGGLVGGATDFFRED